MPFKSVFADVEIPNVDLWTFYLEGSKDFPLDRPIFIDSDAPNRAYAIKDIKIFATEFGKGLRHALNWNKGDVLATFTPNDIDIPVVNMATFWAGGIVSPANPTYTVEELARQLKDSDATALITQKPFLDTARKAAELAGIPLDRVILLGKGRDETGVHRHWSDITARQAWIQPKRVVNDPTKDISYLVYSSGTTGLPKGVALTHRNCVSQAYQLQRSDPKALNWDSDAQLGILPLFHIYGIGVVLHVSFYCGVKCFMMAKFDLERACKLIQDHKITFIYVPPPIILALGKHPVVDKYDLSSLRFLNSAAAPLSRELVVAVWDRLKIGVKQGYGLSETSPTVAAQYIDEWWKFQGSVGRLAPNLSAKIIDESGKELGVDEPGELLVKGPNVFSGYWKKPELNKETFTEDGWYRTGDVAFINAQGHIYITDRIKELIKYKGFQVPPAELEAKLIGRQDIADVCVVGVFDKEQHTEVPRAYVVLTTGVEASDAKASEIIEWLNAKVAPPKKLRGGVRFLDAIPKSQAGKILRRVLRDQVKKEEAEAEAPKAKL